MKKHRLLLTTAALLMAFTLNTGKAKAAENDNNLQDEHNIGLVAETADVRETAPLTANIAGTAATAPTAGYCRYRVKDWHIRDFDPAI